MPAKSKKQQRFFGMVHAVQKGRMKAPSKRVGDVAKSISPTSATHFAETKHKGLPMKKKSNSLGSLAAGAAGGLGGLSIGPQLIEQLAWRLRQAIPHPGTVQDVVKGVDRAPIRSGIRNLLADVSNPFSHGTAKALVSGLGGAGLGYGAYQALQPNEETQKQSEVKEANPFVDMGGGGAPDISSLGHLDNEAFAKLIADSKQRAAEGLSGAAGAGGGLVGFMGGGLAGGLAGAGGGLAGAGRIASKFPLMALDRKNALRTLLGLLGGAFGGAAGSIGGGTAGGLTGRLATPAATWQAMGGKSANIRGQIQDQVVDNAGGALGAGAGMLGAAGAGTLGASAANQGFGHILGSRQALGRANNILGGEFVDPTTNLLEQFMGPVNKATRRAAGVAGKVQSPVLRGATGNMSSALRQLPQVFGITSPRLLKLIRMAARPRNSLMGLLAMTGAGLAGGAAAGQGIQNAITKRSSIRDDEFHGFIEKAASLDDEPSLIKLADYLDCLEFISCSGIGRLADAVRSGQSVKAAVAATFPTATKEAQAKAAAKVVFSYLQSHERVHRLKKNITKGCHV